MATPQTGLESASHLSPSPAPSISDIASGSRPRASAAPPSADDAALRRAVRAAGRTKRFADSMGDGVPQNAFDVAMEEQELLANADIWNEPLHAYAQEMRAKERALEEAFNNQLAEKSLDRALHLTEWAGRSLDVLAEREQQAVTAGAAGVRELTPGEIESRNRKSEAAKEGWARRKADKEAMAEQRALAKQKRLDSQRQKQAEVNIAEGVPVVGSSKLKKGYAMDMLDGPDSMDGLDTAASSPGPMEGPPRKRARTSRASAAAATAHLSASIDLDPNDPDYAHQLELARNALAAETESRANSPEMSPAPDAEDFEEDDEEFITNKKKKGGGSKSTASAGAPLKGLKPYEIAADDLERKLWQQIATTQIPKARKMLDTSLSSRVNFHRRLVGLVQRETIRFQKKTKTQKEVNIRSKRVMREMLTFWKGSDKKDKERKTKAEREALDKVKREEDMREAKRAARKLNFLITQTELYSHFVGSKINTAAAEDTADTAAPANVVGAVPGLSTAVAPMSEQAQKQAQNGELAALNFYDEDESNLNAHARRNAEEAVARARERANAFDAKAAQDLQAYGGELTSKQKAAAAAGEMQLDQAAFDTDELNFQNPTSLDGELLPQPAMLTCDLKEYQLKGLTWLASLYDQGINGILADEMGLGKTVQSIALMAHLAEQHNIWGPFLVIAPASTLHNWQQEITRFVPQLKALPYWGNPKDRQVLRKFWNRSKIRYDKDAPFHILITSYQLVVLDEKYFQRVKWQYMVLDEAQAIKSSSSTRWKTLLNFHCRNRLLLTGTPIQNSMQELWALLHFIMPSLFDSHDEFSDWFAKDIEGGAQKGAMNESQLRRLHMILKPFMLRRIKKNVQNELVDKIEIDVMCDLTTRQKIMYSTLRTNISIADLVARAQSLSTDDTAVKRLMNLIMQFRKVCNHPELFERADVTSPIALCNYAVSGPIIREPNFLDLPYSSASHLRVHLPKAFYREFEVGENNGDTNHLKRMMSIWRPDNIAEAQKQADSTFGFSRLLELSPGDVNTIANGASLDKIRLRLRDERRQSVEQRFDASDKRAYSVVPKTALLPADLNDVEGAFRRASRLKKTDATMYLPKAVSPPAQLICDDRAFATKQSALRFDPDFATTIFGLPVGARDQPDALKRLEDRVPDARPEGLFGSMAQEQVPRPPVLIPQLYKLILDSGKLAKLDQLLVDLKSGDHRVLLYFQMTRMIDLVEEYLAFKGWKYLRLDGTSTIAERRDMVSDWQTKPEIFIFLLSTRAGGLGINLTAADTVIFYDSDWNPSNDAQAMDRAHRLGQTKQVTVYRLITQGTIDERILQLARNKKNVQDAVVGSSNAAVQQQAAAPKSNEVVSLLLDDAEMEATVRQAAARREQTYAKQVADGKRGAAQREANKIAAAEAAKEAAATQSPFNLFGAGDDEDDGFGWFESNATTAGNAGDPEDELAVAKASEAPKKKRAPRKPKDPNAPPVQRKRKPKEPVDPDAPPPPKKKRETKKQKEARLAAAAAANGGSATPMTGITPSSASTPAPANGF